MNNQNMSASSKTTSKKPALSQKLCCLKWLLLALLFAAPKIGMAQGEAVSGVTPSISGAVRGTAEVLREGGKWVAAQATNAVAAPILWIVYPVALLVTFIAGIILTIEGALLSWVIDPNSFPIADLPAVIQGWGVVRDLANMAFILALVWMAFATMLRLETYGARQTLWRLIVAALLVNFSFIIGAGIIDVAEILTIQLLGPVGGGKGLIDSFMSVVGIVQAVLPSPISVLWKSTAGLITNLVKTDTPNLWLIFNSVMGAIFVLILVFIMLAAVIFMVIRILYLWILLIFAPFAWVSWIFPASRRWWSEWWSNFLRWTFFAPIFVFFMYLSLSILQGVRAAQGGGLIQWPTVQNINSDANPEVFMMFFLSCGLLIAGLLTANKFGIAGAGMVMNMGKFLRGFGYAQVSRWVSRGMKLPETIGVGKFRIPVQKWITGAGKAGAPAWQKAITAPIRGLQWAGAAGLLSPSAIKRGYAAMSARADAVAYNESSGRLQDLVYRVISRGQRQTAYGERGQQATEQMLGEEVTKTARTEEQLSAVINQLAGGRNEVERATLISLLEKQASINGINTTIANLPQAIKDAVQKDAIAIAKAEGYAPEIIDAMEKGGEVDQGLFLRAWLQRSLGDENRAGRVANDIGVIGRAAGNHSFSGLSDFNKATGKFEWNNYIELQNSAVNQFKKGPPQDTMRRFHPDIFMRDASGKLTTTLSAAGRKILASFQPGHIREGLQNQQLRPETLEFLRKISATDPNLILNQYTDPAERKAVETILTHQNVKP